MVSPGAVPLRCCEEIRAACDETLFFVEFAAEYHHGYGLIVGFGREVFGPLAAVADANGVALVRAEDAIVESFALAKSLSVAGEGQSRDQHGGIAG